MMDEEMSKLQMTYLIRQKSFRLTNYRGNLYPVMFIMPKLYRINRV